MAHRVAPLAGSVDRNNKDEGTISLLEVAPLAGSVDRNTSCLPEPQKGEVAPLAGSVDRNCNGTRLHPWARSRSPRGERG